MNADSEHPTPLEAGFDRIVTPFQVFAHDQSTAGYLLVVCTVTALIVANSPLAHGYEALIETQLGFVVGDRTFEMSVHHWVNSGMMSLFFFRSGLGNQTRNFSWRIRKSRSVTPCCDCRHRRDGCACIDFLWHQSRN